MTQGFGLSATARLALLQRLSRRKEEKGPAPGAARAFRELPGQRDMELIREAAGALGLENPFFRPHEGIAAATTVIGNREVINYGSHNYLGLNGDARVMRLRPPVGLLGRIFAILLLAVGMELAVSTLLYERASELRVAALKATARPASAGRRMARAVSHPAIGASTAKAT